jgi:hypothetical protein
VDGDAGDAAGRARRAFTTVLLVSLVGGVTVATVFSVVVLELGTFASDPSVALFVGALILGIVYGLLIGAVAGLVVGLLNGLLVSGLLSSGMAPAAARRVTQFAAPVLTGGPIALVSWEWLLRDASLELEGWLIFLALPAVVGALAAELAVARVPQLRRLFA